MVYLKNPTGPASENAFKYATDLICKAAAQQPATRIKMLTSLATMDAEQVSNTIKLMEAGLKVKASEAKVKTANTAPASAQAVPGHYMIDGTHYQVKQSKLTKYSYVMKNGSYLGAKGPEAEKVLAAVLANGKEYAIAYAKVTSKCGICNTKLTDPKSIAAGIGPICAEKF